MTGAGGLGWWVLILYTAKAIMAITTRPPTTAPATIPPIGGPEDVGEGAGEVVGDGIGVVV
jgi:hypothetical protein